MDDTLKKYIVSPDMSVKDAVKKIDQSGRKAVAVLDTQGILVGLFSDGDMRKYILQNGDMDQKVLAAMNPKPEVCYTRAEFEREQKERRRVVYLLVDARGELLDMVFGADVGKKKISKPMPDTPLVIMAGGKGTRLKPYTDILPKALVPIGNITITERIIGRFIAYDCKDVFLILNHKKNMIKAYFNDLDCNYNIHYAEETKPLGTAGGLALLQGKIDRSFFVSNCDILIDTDYACIYDYHKEQGNAITMVCAMKNVVMPYGVVRLDDSGYVKRIEEKPTQSYLTNTGLYILEPEALRYIKAHEVIDLTGLILRLVENQRKVGVYPISESCWMDMGQINEMEDMLSVLGEE